MKSVKFIQLETSFDTIQPKAYFLQLLFSSLLLVQHQSFSVMTINKSATDHRAFSPLVCHRVTRIQEVKEDNYMSPRPVNVCKIQFVVIFESCNFLSLLTLQLTYFFLPQLSVFQPRKILFFDWTNEWLYVQSDSA